MMKSPLWTILLAAGQGTRLSKALGGTRKQFLLHQGVPLYWRSVQTMAHLAELKGMVLVFPALELDQCTQELDQLKKLWSPGVPIVAVAGGQRRQDSVRMGLLALPRDCGRVLVHDAARPFFSLSLVVRLLEALDTSVQGVIPALPVTDTIKQVAGDKVVLTLQRHELRAVQTPQLFAAHTLRQVHDLAEQKVWEVTDDASMLERAGFDVGVVLGEPGNIKITLAEDLVMLDQKHAPSRPCTGLGYDVHAYGGHRPMVLGGIPIAGAPMVKAHSDGDVLLHALCDALLGCLGLGDIGSHFPDTDPRFENISSAILLSEVLELSKKKGLILSHVDTTLIAQVPRLAPHREAIRANVARLLELDNDQVNVKASTEEFLGFTGRKEGIKAMVVVTGVMPSR
ncbi:MAG: 2-C-methyl-D-erythritol 4-phosphate cytidylyltransferase [Desulfomicrobium sp.]|nr:2-C-methyl-D-erythritol 4-phosphate cytidylyltransferase [Desulfomicrobium sp.]